MKDHLGSVRLVTNASTGAIVQELTYDAWGRVLADTNPGFQPFGFACGLYDPETGLVRYGVRDYDAEIGRWTAKDPVRFDGGENLYAYGLAEPANQQDPAGTSSSAGTDSVPASTNPRTGAPYDCKSCVRMAKLDYDTCYDACIRKGDGWDICITYCDAAYDSALEVCRRQWCNGKKQKPLPRCE